MNEQQRHEINDRYKDIFCRIKDDSRYIEGITYGKPRKGHEEGSVANHLDELRKTLNRISIAKLLTLEDYWKLLILVEVHDTFKLEGKRRTGHQVSIRDPNSHASLAREFLAEFTDDKSMLAIVQFHDEGHALWQQQQKRGHYQTIRLIEALQQIPDVELYLIFTIIDGYTTSKLKDRSPRWFVTEVAKHAYIGPRVDGILNFLGI